eukprot:4884836-Pleurochrysis_carterae.AAC.1
MCLRRADRQRVAVSTGTEVAACARPAYQRRMCCAVRARARSVTARRVWCTQVRYFLLDTCIDSVLVSSLEIDGHDGRTARIRRCFPVPNPTLIPHHAHAVALPACAPA